MKKTLTILLILVSSLSMAQNYKLFNANSKKLFTDYPSPLNAYSISFDTAYQSGADSVYFNFCKVDNYMYPSNSFCNFAFYPCYHQIIPSWIGKKVMTDNNLNYQLFNLAGDTLKFGFNLNTSDTLVFYQDLTQKFKLVYQNSDTLTILNNVDSARFYKIIHSDLLGNIIPSALNQQHIIIAKNWGLTQFFQVDSFPQVLKPVSLIGNIAPIGGFNELTNEIVYNFEIGDEFQFHEYYYLYGGQPWLNYERYRKYTILNKVITTDSLKYIVAQEYFDVDSLVLHSNTIDLNYSRSSIISNIPYEKYIGQGINSLIKSDYCGQKLWTFTNRNESYFYEYCPTDSSWCTNSEPGPPVKINTQYVEGLGIYYDNSSYISAMGGNGSYNRNKTMNYYNKNGVSCGSEMRVGIDEYSATNHKIFVNPNPASSFINITSPFEFKNITIFNMEGRKLISKQISGSTETIETKNLSEGVYFAVIQFEDNTIATKKIVIIKN